MIKAIVADVDGVIVGKKHGINFPLPSEAVMQKLNELHKRGIPIVLNTAKFNKAILEIIKKAQLQNPHITDGGALIIDPLSGQVIRKHVLGKVLVREIGKACLQRGLYTEFYASDEGYLQKNQKGDLYKKRVTILQQELTLVDSIIDQVDELDIIKIMSFLNKPEDRALIEQLLEPFKEELHVIFSYHPLTYPIENAVITAKGVSKKDATVEVLNYLHITPEETLGIGDTLGDWNFISICGYVAVTGTHSSELIKHAASKGDGKYFLAKDADNDGFLEITNYFFG